MRQLILFTLLLLFAQTAHAQTGICTAEARICPDGTAVGRGGPNCEFAPCPQAPLAVAAQPRPWQSKGREWGSAEAKWSAFTQEHLDRMKTIDSALPAARSPGHVFEMEWIELESRWIDKYLPGYRIFVDRRFTFALNQAGRIVSVGPIQAPREPYASAPDLERMTFSRFLVEFKLAVPDEDTAIELVELCEIIHGNGYTTDRELEKRRKDWVYQAELKDDAWRVSLSYVGPPASISTQPVTGLQLDPDGHVESIKVLGPGGWEY